MDIFRRLTAVAMCASLLGSTTLAQAFEACGTSGDKVALNFTVRPSLVVTDPAMLDLKQGDIGLTEHADEGIFSFRRTIRTILASANADSSSSAQAEFVRTLTRSFGQTAGLNAEAGVMMPMQSRPAEQGLVAEQMLDESSGAAMRPLAVFNRLDLAPSNWSTCGEYRIVYGHDPVPNNPIARFLLIFEAAVPNPGVGAEGCKQIVELWAGLSESGLSNLELAKRLSAFYYDGKTSPTLSTPDLRWPVIDYRDLGGDQGFGQVRGNAFMQFQWQLREWHTRRTFISSGSTLAMTPHPLKDNPLAELYHDTVSVPNNLAEVVSLLHGEFVRALVSEYATNLVPEAGTTMAGQLAMLEQFDLGPSPVDADTVLIGSIGFGGAQKFNEFQSESSGDADVPGGQPGLSQVLRALLDQRGKALSNALGMIDSEIVLNRATANSCGGCHQTAANLRIVKPTSGTALTWPAAASGGFVHVTEAHALSPALEQRFLPFRRLLMGQYLCRPADVAAFDAAVAGQADSREAGVGPFVDQLAAAAVARHAQAQPLSAPITNEAADDTLTELADLPLSQLDALNGAIAAQLDVARSTAARLPGAFVDHPRAD